MSGGRAAAKAGTRSSGNGVKPEPLPPHDVDAEEAVIASLLVDPEAMYKVSPIITPVDFFREKNAWAFEACLALSERGESVNQITVAHELSQRRRLEEVGGVAYLSRLVTDLPTSIGVEHYAAIVQETAARRRCVSLAQALARAAYSGDDVDIVLDRLEETRENAPAVAAVEIGATPEPEPLEDLIEGLQKVGSLAGFYGTEGVAKTILAIYRDVCLAAGLPFLGRPVRRSIVMFTDFELYEDEFARNAWPIARGLGLERPPDGLFYLQADRPLLEMMPAIRAAIRRTGADSLTIDSLSMAGVVDEGSALAARRELVGLGVSVCLIDHQARPQRVEPYAAKAPYGTRFKEAMLASLFQIELAEVQPPGGIDLLLRDKKNRHGPHRPDMGVRISFGAGAVTVEAIDPEASLGLVEKLGGFERTLTALKRLGKAMPKEIAEHTGLSLASVKTFLSRAKRIGLAADSPGQTSRDPHLWRPSTSTPSTRDEKPAARVDPLIGVSTHQRGERAGETSTRSTPESTRAVNADGETCRLCDGDVEMYTPAGVPLCAEHAQERTSKGVNP